MLLADVRACALRSLIPPPLWPYQREIADAISNPMVERVTLVKGVRLGFTTLLTGRIGAYVANEPAAILCVLPTDSDCRDYCVSELETIFAATPALRDALSSDTDATLFRDEVRHPGTIIAFIGPTDAAFANPRHQHDHKTMKKQQRLAN